MPEDEFSEKIDWRRVTLGFVAWTVHFSLLWAASSVFPGQLAARWIALAATLGAFIALALLWRGHSQRSHGLVEGLALGLAGTAIGFGALPALIG